MSLVEDIGFAAEAEGAATPSRARTAVLKRLADVVCLPSSRVNAFERSITADLLVEVLRDAAVSERARVARRLGGVADIPNPLCRLMLRDVIEVAGDLLEHSLHLREDDLLDCVRTATAAHRRLIAARRGLGEVLCDGIAEHGEAAAMEILLRNDSARLGQNALEAIITASRANPPLTPLLIHRPELRPAQAYMMFWWADAELRKLILRRFAVSREVLQDAVSDIFAVAAEEGWQDEPARKALQFIERRQRNRAALARSPFDSLEAAVAAGAADLTPQTADEIAYLAGVKPATGGAILADPGGEPIAVLCKACGLPRGAVIALWRGLKRPEIVADGGMHPHLARVLEAYDLMAVDRAQTVLRYWNWALSSAQAPTAIRVTREDGDTGADDYTRSATAAMLA